MTSTRLNRLGRCRFVIGIIIFTIFFGFILIFHASQQVGDLKQQNLKCEQRLQSVLEKKFLIENNLESERQEHRITREELAKKAKEENENHYKADLEANIRLDRLKQSLKFLQSEHNDLVEECLKSKKQQSEQINLLEKKVLSFRSELQKEKNNNAKEIAAWTEKYNIIVQEKINLEKLIKIVDLKSLNSKINVLKEVVNEYEMKCPHIPSVWKDHGDILETNNFLNSLHTASVTNVSHASENSRNNKSVSNSIYVSPNSPKLSVEANQTKPIPLVNMVSASVKTNSFLINSTNQNLLSNNTFALNSTPQGISNYVTPLIGKSDAYNRSLIINSVENFQIIPKTVKNNFGAADAIVAINSNSKYNVKISPLSSPLKHLTEENRTTFKPPQEELIGFVSNETIRHNSIGLQVSPSKKFISSEKENHQTSHKQLPLGVAPIPENFDGILKNDQINISNKTDEKTNDNNRYSNVLKDMRKVYKRDNLPDGDSAGTDVKEEDLNGQNHENDFFNSNLIDVNNKEQVDFEIPYKKEESNENQKNQRNRLIENDNLNNEVAGDQGKEFLDGLRLEDGNDEDEDEDDYSNPVVRKKEDLAVRN